MNKLNGKAAGFDYIAGLVRDQLDLVCQPVLFQLQFDQTIGHSSAVNRADHLLHAVGDGTNVVFVAVCDEHAAKLLCVLDKIRKIGDYKINTVHVFIWESNATVYDNHILTIFQDCNVLANLIKTAKRNDF